MNFARGFLKLKKKLEHFLHLSRQHKSIPIQ